MTPKSFALLAATIMCACAWCACITNESEAAVQHGSSTSPLWSLSLSAYELQTDSNKTYHVYVGAAVTILSEGDEGGNDEFAYNVDSVTSGYGLTYDSSYGDYAYHGKVSGTVSKAGTIQVGYSGYNGPSFSGSAVIKAYAASYGTASAPLSSLDVDAYDLHNRPAKEYYVYVGSPVSIVSVGDEGGFEEFAYNVDSVTFGYGLAYDSSYGGETYSGKVSGTISKAGDISIHISGYNGPSFSETVTVHAIAKSTAVTGVTLDRTSATLAVGSTLKLTPTVSPSGASDKTVTWKSSNKNVATVSSAGVVTAKAAGTTTITVTTNDGGKTATCQVTVTSASVPVTGVTLDQSQISVNVGGSYAFVATVSPSNATNKAVTWSTSDSSIVSITTGGVARGVSPGTAAITATTSDGGKTATCQVTVLSPTYKVTVKVGAYDCFKMYSPSSASGTYRQDTTFDVAAGEKVDVDWIKDPVTTEYPTYTVTTTYKKCGSEKAGTDVWNDGGYPTSNCTVTPATATPAVESSTTSYRFTLTYDGNGSTSGTVPSQQTATDSSQTHSFTLASKGTMARSGYKFLGWSESKTTTTASYKAGASYSMTAGEKTLYAVWQKNALVVSGTPEPYGVVGTAWSYKPTVNVTSYSMTVSGASWLVASSGMVSGTPDAPGEYDVTLTFKRSGYTSATQSFKVTVLSALTFDSNPTGGAIIYAV